MYRQIFPFTPLPHALSGQEEWVICREFDIHIKLVSGMVLGGTHARIG